MVKRLSLVVFLAIFSLWVSSVSANLTQLELTPTSLTCNATGTIYYSSATNQLMLCTSGTGSSPIVTGASNVWTLSGSNLYPNSTSYNVGIGTTNPNGYKLYVNGQTRVTGDPTPLSVYYPDNSGWAGRGIFGGDTAVAVLGEYATTSVYMGAHNAALNAWYPVYINPGANVYMVSSSGNVGIGTTNVSSAGLVVARNVSSVGIDVQNNRIQNVGAPINANDAATKSYVDSSIAGGSGSSVGYWTLSSSDLYANSTGYNVAIGATTASGYKLYVNGGEGLNGTLSLFGGGKTASIWNDGNLHIKASAGGDYLWLNADTVAFYNYAQTAALGSLSSGGLSVVGNSFNLGSGSGMPVWTQYWDQPNGRLYMGFSGSSGGDIQFYANGTNNGATQWFHTNGSANFAGSVGINMGVSTPGTTLDVAGNTQASIFYDRDNTSYYLDPAANTMPYAANLGGGINVGGNITIGNPYGIITGSNTGVLHHTYTQTQTGWSNSASTNTFWIKLMTITVGPGSGYSGLKMYGTVFGSDDAQNGLEKMYLGFNQSPGNSNITNVSRIQEFNSNKISDLRVVRTSSNTDPTSVAVTYDVYILLGSSWLNNYNIKWEWDTDGLYSVAFTNNQTEVTTAPTGYAYQDEMADSFNFVNGTINAAGLKTTGTMYSVEVDNATSTGATTVDWSKSNTQTVILGASIALTFTNGQPGGHYTLALKQDATGSRTITSWGSNVRFSSGIAPTLTTTANKTDYIEFVYDGLSSTFDGVGFNANF